jgi:acetolactate synthase-1/3 small subunit
MHTLVVSVEDRPGVLTRVASLFRRRGFNIDSLTVGHSDEPGVSRMTLVVDADDETILRLEASLYKLVNVLRVEHLGRGALVRDLALIKVRADAAARGDVLRLVEALRARVIDVGAEALVVEMTGTPDEIDQLAIALHPFGVLELVRTGAIAMKKALEGERRWPRSNMKVTSG